jgi:3-dehydroquinate synthase
MSGSSAAPPRAAGVAARAAAPSAAAPPSSQPLTTGSVELDGGARAYPIYIGPAILDQRPELLRKHIPGSRVLIVTNETVAPLYLEKVKNALEQSSPDAPAKRVDSVVLPDGEAHKTLDVLEQVFDAALKLRLDRGVTFLALGGGVVGDMTGFAAACYQRGVHFLQVPTTVMAQVR